MSMRKMSVLDELERLAAAAAAKELENDGYDDGFDSPQAPFGWREAERERANILGSKDVEDEKTEEREETSCTTPLGEDFSTLTSSFLGGVNYGDNQMSSRDSETGVDMMERGIMEEIGGELPSINDYFQSSSRQQPPRRSSSVSFVSDPVQTGDISEYRAMTYEQPSYSHDDGGAQGLISTRYRNVSRTKHERDQNKELVTVGSHINGSINPAGERETEVALSWHVKFVKAINIWSKEQLSRVLYGETCKIQLTAINLLVVCSFVFLFIEVVALAFLPADWDYFIAFIGLTVWLVLVSELILERLIRPANYSELISSEKAFAPSTARHLNQFHLACETIGLLTFIPEFDCLTSRVCGRRVAFSLIEGMVSATFATSTAKAALGRFRIGLAAFRLFGLVRHWKQMEINNTYNDRRGMVQNLFHENATNVRPSMSAERDQDAVSDQVNSNLDETPSKPLSEEDHGSKPLSEEDRRLERAATIGTALMVVNSQRALLLLVAIITILPMIQSLGGQNRVAPHLVSLLNQNNMAARSNSSLDCSFLQDAVSAWLDNVASEEPGKHVTLTLLWARLQPVRCPFQSPDGVITVCTKELNVSLARCDVWTMLKPSVVTDATPKYFATKLNTRVGGIMQYAASNSVNGQNFAVTGLFDENLSVAFAAKDLCVLLATYLVLVLVGLSVLKHDANRLVLDPLRRILKIVIRYAENPLAEDVQETQLERDSGAKNFSRAHDGIQKAEMEQLGQYETEQLIKSISKTAGLLRMCWGVAGADIISSNLARTKDGKTVVFNATVPGKRVYALFGFVGINGFSQQLREHDKKVMIFINNVAKVVHDEVHRWSFENRGQCNRNLGAAFLMVFRIEECSEVHKKIKKAIQVAWQPKKESLKTKRSGSAKTAPVRRSRNKSASCEYHHDTLQLSSLPGIQHFADRALLGLLKSFAGIHRDKKVHDPLRNDAFSGVDVIYGMDAGWAVEGAVGSEYKIDATYLSPHVNMASRMMSATKQYGVTILLSQAVEELLSKSARDKLRHLDTVTVKGSSVPQRIFTFDARHKGVDFWLLERSPELCDADAANDLYAIWDDQDLTAMRKHVSDAFMKKFKEGVKQYLKGYWKASIETLMEADNMMIENAIDQGQAGVLDPSYIDDVDDMKPRILDRTNNDKNISWLRSELCDGPCQCLISLMEKRKGIPPADWNGVRKLESK